MSSIVSMSDPPSMIGSPALSVSSLPSSRTVRRHEHFYFRYVVFEVSGVLFKVPRYGMPGTAAAFEARFFTPGTSGASEDGSTPGSSDDNPIRLDEDVSEFDFASLLKAMYPPPGTTLDSVQLTTEEWMSVLKLAKKFELPQLRDKAINMSSRQVASMTSLDKILFAKRHGVAKWLREAYREVGRRENTITEEEKNQLGLPTYIRLLELRDRVWEYATSQCRGSYWYDSYKDQFQFDTAIDEIFGDEVKDS